MDNNYEKRNDILYAAVYLFSKNGFTATSVQDIASHCNVSKATIYKLFKSKEDILIEIIKHSNRQLLLLVKNINLNNSMNEMEKFEEELYIFFEFLTSRRDLSFMIYQEQTLCKDEEFKKIFTEIKILVLNWFKTILLETFKGQIENIIWDMVIALEGLIKQYTQVFIMQEIIVKDIREISNYTAKNIAALVAANSKSEPILPIDFISNLNIHTQTLFNTEILMDEAQKIIANLKASVKHSKTILNKEEVTEAINTISEEKNSSSPRKYIIDGLFLYLFKYSELERELLFLKQIYKKV